ncbi:MAG: hypothetical protein ACJ72E_16805 [Marmoricola sp.]
MRKAVVVLLSVLALVLGLSSYADAAKAPYKVSLATSVAKSSAGRFITVSGHVTGPKAAGHSVTIQRHFVGGPWVTVASATISSRGNYRARVETPRGGTTSFRAIKGRSSVRSAGVSPTRSLPVYEWLYLANVNAIATQGVLQNTSVTIAGKTYARSITMNGTSPGMEVKLGGLCTTLTSTLQYQSTNGSIVPASMNFAFAVYPAGGGPATPTTGQLDTSFVVPLTIPLTGGNVLQMLTSNMDSDYQYALGDPKVYCNADHLPSWTSSDL